MAKPIDPSDEYWHEPRSDDPKWRESYYFDFYDPEHDLGYSASIGKRTNKGYIGSITILTWDGSLYLRKDYGYPTDDGAIQVAGMQYTVEEPHERWRLRQISEVNQFESGSDEMRRPPDAFPSDDVPLFSLDLDLTFSAIHPPQYYSPTGLNEEILSSMFSEHCDQAGRVMGEVTIGGETLSVDTFGERDHSWGVRDWEVYDSWQWISALFDEDFGVNAWRATESRGTAAEGFLHYQGESTPLEKVSLDTEYQEDGFTPEMLTLEVVDSHGREVRLTGTTLDEKVAYDLKHDSGQLAFKRPATRFEADATDELGYGWAEYAHQLT